MSQAISKSTQVSVASAPAWPSHLLRLEVSGTGIHQILRNANVQTTMNICAKLSLRNRGESVWD